MENQCDQIATLRNYLLQNAAIINITKNTSNIIKLTLNEKLSYLGVTEQIYDNLWHACRQDQKLEEIKELCESILQEQVVIPFIGYLDSIHPELQVLKILLAFISQRSPYKASFEWIDQEFVNQPFESQILQYLWQTGSYYSTVPAYLYSQSSNLQFATIYKSQQYETEFRPWRISWRLKSHVLLSTALLFNHLWDHYSIDHFHEAQTVSEAETMILISIRRTWTAMRDYREDRLNENSRINFGYRLVNVSRITERDANLFTRLNYGHVMEPNMLASQVRSLGLQQVKEIVMDRMKDVDLEGEVPETIPITAEQKNLITELGRECVRGRFKVVDPINLEMKSGLKVKVRRINQVPLGDEFKLNDIIKSITHASVKSEAKEPYGFTSMEIPKYDTHLKDLKPYVSPGCLKSASLPQSRDITVDSLIVRKLMARYTDDNISVNVSHQLYNALITIALSLDPNSPVIMKSDSTITISSLGGILNPKPMYVHILDLPFATLLSQISYLFWTKTQTSLGLYRCCLLNSPKSEVFENMWRKVYEYSYYSTTEDYDGSLIDKPSGLSNMYGIFNYAKITSAKFSDWTKFIEDVCSVSQVENCNILEVKSADLSYVLDIVSDALMRAKKEEKILIFTGPNTILAEQTHLVILAFRPYQDGKSMALFEDSLNIATVSDRELVIQACLNPYGVLPIASQVKRVPNFNLPALDITTGTSIRVNTIWEKVNEGVGFVSSVCRFTNLRKTGTSDWPQSEITGITDKSRSSYLRRIKMYRRNTESFSLDNFEYTSPKSAHLYLGSISAEEIVTQTDREIIYYLRESEQIGSINNSLNDFGSGYLLNVHQTNMNYVMYDRTEYSIEDAGGITMVVGEIDLNELLPADETYDTLAYNSIYFIDSWDSYRGSDGTLTAWLDKHFEAVTLFKSNAYINFPVMWDELFTHMEQYFNLTKEEGKYKLKLNAYPNVECISTSDLLSIITYFQSKQAKVFRLMPSYSDYGYAMRAIGRSGTLELVNQAHLLHLCLTTLVVQF